MITGCNQPSDWLRIEPMRHSESAALVVVGSIPQFDHNMNQAIMLRV